MKSLFNIHREVKMVNTNILSKEREIKEMRSNLLERIKQLLKLNHEKSCRIGFDLKINTNNYKEYLLLPFFKDTDYVSNEKLRLNYRNFIITLLQNVNSFFNELNCIKKIDYKINNLPNGIYSCDFFAFSTLPCLFSNLWADDLKEKYINLLVTSLSRLSKDELSRYDEHWVFYCIKYYLINNSICEYFKICLRDAVFLLINRSPMSITRDEINGASKDILKKLKESICIFPNELKLFINRFSSYLGESDLESKFLNDFFCSFVLEELLLRPKIFGIIPSTYYYDFQSTHYIQAVLRIMDIIKEDIDDVISIMQTASHIIQSRKSSYLEVLSHVEDRSFQFFVSNTDIFILANIVYDILQINKDSKLKICATYVMNIIKDEGNSDFAIYNISSDNSMSLNLKQTDVKTGDTEDYDINCVCSAAHSLFNFLVVSTLDTVNEEKLGDFLEHHKVLATLRNDPEALCLLNNLLQKLSVLDESSVVRVVPKLLDIIQEKKDSLFNMDEVVTNLAYLINNLTDIYKSHLESTNGLVSQLCICLLKDYIKKSHIEDEIHTRSSDFYQSSEAFSSFFNRINSRIIKSFPFSEEITTNIIGNLHSWILQHFSLSSFTKYNPEFLKKDKIILEASSDDIERVCVTPADKKLQKLFSSLSLFLYAQNELKEALTMPCLVESLRKISSCFHLLDVLYLLGVGNRPQADDMTPLINYIIIKSIFKNMYSFVEYIDHFLLKLDCDFLDDVDTLNATHFVNHVRALPEIILQTNNDMSKDISTKLNFSSVI